MNPREPGASSAGKGVRSEPRELREPVPGPTDFNPWLDPPSQVWAASEAALQDQPSSPVPSSWFAAPPPPTPTWSGRTRDVGAGWVPRAPASGDVPGSQPVGCLGHPRGQTEAQTAASLRPPCPCSFPGQLPPKTRQCWVAGVTGPCRDARGFAGRLWLSVGSGDECGRDDRPDCCRWARALLSRCPVGRRRGCSEGARGRPSCWTWLLPTAWRPAGVQAGG